MIAFRPEASLIYVNADSVLERVLNRLRVAGPSDIRLVICDLSASPYLDLAGSRMLHDLHSELACAASHFASWAPMERRGIYCERMGWTKKPGASTASRRLMKSSLKRLMDRLPQNRGAV